MFVPSVVQVVYFYLNFKMFLNLFVFVSVDFRISLAVFILRCLSFLCFCLLLRFSGCISRLNGLDGFALFVICFNSFVSNCFMLYKIVLCSLGCFSSVIFLGVRLFLSFELCFRFFQVASGCFRNCFKLLLFFFDSDSQRTR